MPLLGTAAMLLSFDVADEAIAEHDAWHTHEHLPERLAIPGFLRGTRWVALSGPRRYFVLYEVASLAVLTSSAYLERLNHPSPWTAKLMPFYRGMARGFCHLAGSFGHGLGHVALMLRFTPAAGAEASVREWLLQHALPGLPTRPGIGSAHLLENAQTPPMTNEQRIRGRDAGFDWTLWVTGYDAEALAGLMQGGPGLAQLEAHGATGIVPAIYRMDYALTDRELGG